MYASKLLLFSFPEVIRSFANFHILYSSGTHIFVRLRMRTSTLRYGFAVLKILQQSISIKGYLMLVIYKLAGHQDYLRVCVAPNIFEAKQVLDAGNNFVW